MRLNLLFHCLSQLFHNLFCFSPSLLIFPTNDQEMFRFASLYCGNFEFQICQSTCLLIATKCQHVVNWNENSFSFIKLKQKREIINEARRKLLWYWTFACIIVMIIDKLVKYFKCVICECNFKTILNFTHRFHRRRCLLSAFQIWISNQIIELCRLIEEKNCLRCSSFFFFVLIKEWRK